MDLFFKSFNKIEEKVSGILFVLMFFILIMQVFARQVFNSPLIWSEQLSLLLFVYVGLFGVSIGIRNQSHIMIDFIFTKLPKTVQKIVFTLIQLIILTCIYSFLYFGLDLLTKKRDIMLVALNIPRNIMYIALPVISLLMLVRFYQSYKENWSEKLVLIDPRIVAIFMGIILALILLKPSIFNLLRLENYFYFGSNTVYIVLILWLVLIFLSVPVGWSLLISTMVYFSLTNWNVMYFASSKLVDSIESFSLLSVPFFILTGILMNGAGITERIFNFAKACLGHYTGGMGHVNVFASLIFSGMSGSALADAGGLGQLEIKAMRDEGYDDDICGGITAASCIIGPLVPPSISMIIYGVIANQSVARLFLAGFIPGILTTITLMIAVYFVVKKRGYKKASKTTFKERWEAFKKAFFALLTPIIIIGGIFSGKFTPTEAAIMAALYSMILGLFIYKELTIKKIFECCIEAITISGVTILMIMTVTFFGDMLAREQVAIKLASVFLQIASSKIAILIMVNLLLLFLGMFIDALALQFLLLPMLIPIVDKVGIDLVFFGVMSTLNMMIGILTPPMGMALFVVAQVSKIPVSEVIRGTLPFLIPIAITLLILILFPSLVTFLPNLILGAV